MWGPSTSGLGKVPGTNLPPPAAVRLLSLTCFPTAASRQTDTPRTGTGPWHACASVLQDPTPSLLMVSESGKVRTPGPKRRGSFLHVSQTLPYKCCDPQRWFLKRFLVATYLPPLRPGSPSPSLAYKAPASGVGLRGPFSGPCLRAPISPTSTLVTPAVSSYCPSRGPALPVEEGSSSCSAPSP